MANQKAQIHDIPLQTMDLCMNKYNADIKPYEGFRKNNSPFYGNVLSPFYSRTSTSVGENSYVAPNGTIYKIKDGNLYVVNENTELKLIDLTGAKALTKKTFVNSGNARYSEILGFLENYGDDKTPYMLCADASGYVQVIDINGNQISNWFEAGSGYFNYKPGQKVHFCKALPDGRIIYSYGIYLFCRKGVSDNYTYDLDYYTSSGDASATASYKILDDGTVLICARLTLPSGSESFSYRYIENGDTNIKTIESIVCTPSESTDTPITLTPASAMVLFNTTGKVLAYGTTVSRSVSSKIRIYHFGEISGLSDTTLNITMYGTAYEDVATLASSNYRTFEVVHDNYALYAVSAFNASWWMHYDTVYGTRTVPITKTHRFLWWTWETTEGYRTEQYVIREARDEVMSGGFRATLYDGVTGNADMWIGLNASGYYQGGLYSTISDTLRILYYGSPAGIDMQAVSTTTDKSLVGTLLCTSGEALGIYSICYGRNTNNDEYICYNDAEGWQMVTLDSDTTKYELTDIGSGYVLINTNAYYNCYDTNNLKLKHFASDYNNRAVFKGSYSVANGFDEYLTKSNNFYFSSAQGAGYVQLGSPFISTLYPSCTSLYGVNTKTLTVRIMAGYTPDDNDIDVYFGSVESGDNAYQFSYDKSGKYINERLSGTSYIDDTVLTPSIFAKFINGFINQGIVIDNGHSYMQVYANTTKPIFGIRIDQQLEGVEAAFIIQGQFFVIINRAIYAYYTDGSLSSVVNIGNMKLIGYTPYQALLWSDTNKTFYTFMGDNTLNMLVQADEINEIVNTAYNPNTMSIYIMTDDGIYIFGTNQLLRLDTDEYHKCFPLDNGAVFIGEDALYISYNKTEGYTALPIILETEFYGEGSSIKSVNDCVYIRLFGEDLPAGQVKLKCWAMNEGSFKSEEKIFNVTPEMWDKESKTLFLRYQPQYQEATGFSVHIETPFPIATLQISETPVTVQNSKYNA